MFLNGWAVDWFGLAEFSRESLSRHQDQGGCMGRWMQVHDGQIAHLPKCVSLVLKGVNGRHTNEEDIL